MKNIEDLDGMFEYKSGDRVPYGNYVCALCDGEEPHIEMICKDGDKLPDCPECGGPTVWVKF